MFSAYESFMRGETVANGRFREIGTDLTGSERIAVADLAGELRAWGVRDAGSRRTLLWIDNAFHTWKNVVDGATVPPASATLVIQGFRADRRYTVEWWDPYQTELRQALSRQSVVAQADGSIALEIHALASDRAAKIYAVSGSYLPLALRGVR
jgi:hypothetical protein